MLVPDACVNRQRMLVTKTAKSVTKSQSCRQHISSPTSVTNIDVASLNNFAPSSFALGLFLLTEISENKTFILKDLAVPFYYNNKTVNGFKHSCFSDRGLTSRSKVYWKSFQILTQWKTDSASRITSKLDTGLESKISIPIQRSITINSIFIFINCWRSKFWGHTWYVFWSIALHYFSWN